MNEREVFIAALQKESAEERRAYLDELCGGNEALRRGVEALLAVHERAGSFLERPIAEANPSPAKPLGEKPGTAIGPYKLLEQIGEGGFGIVFMAEQMQPIRRKVALKVLKPGMDTHHVVARFEAERQALALMDHPNIARVFDGGETSSGRPYFVMELVRGIPITDFCDQNQFSIRERLELFVSICQAVQHAHQKGIIHRDLKPSNVLVTLHDGTPVVKVIDFGVAKALGQELTDKTLFTGFAQMIGTPLYMSPEQAGISGLDVDTRSDIYALGVLLYELLTGTTPFDKEQLRTAGYDEMCRIIREEEAPRPSTRLSTLGQAALTVSANRRSDPKNLSQLMRGELDWIILKALEKDRNRRYESASTFAADVQRYLNDDPVLACPPSAWYRFNKFARRNKSVLAIASVIALAALLVVGVITGSLGWMARDRSVRQTRLNDEIKRALDEAETACDQAMTLTDNPYQWETVLAGAASAIKRADGMAAQQDIGLEPAVQQRLEAVRARLDMDENDRRFVARFDEIRLEQAEIHEAASDFKLAITFPAFKKVFQTHYGIVLGETLPEKLLRILEQRPRPIRQYLVAALDFSLAYLPKEEQAAKAWLATVLREVDSSDPWRSRARVAMRARDWQALSKLLEGRAAARQAVVLLGLEAANPWDDPMALDLWRYSQQTYPSDFWANHDLACVLHYSLRPPRLEEAIRYYTAAIALRPRSPTPYVNLGNVLRDKGELDNAIAVYRKAIAIAPGYPTAHDRLRRALERKGCLDEAIADAREMIRLRNDKRDQVVLGNYLVRRGQRDEAITCFRKVIACYRGTIERNPQDDLSCNDLAWILATCPERQFRNPAAAVELAQRAVELMPRKGDYWNTLGVAHYRAGHWKDAVAVQEKSMKLRNGGDSFDWFFLAMAHGQLGEKEKARQWFEQAVAWMEKNEPTDSQLLRFRAEAAELLKIEEKNK